MAHNAIDAALTAERQASGEQPNTGIARRNTLQEETVEQLLAKLAKKGKNVKVVAEEEEQNAQQQALKQAEEMRQLQELMSNMEAQLVKGGEALEEAEKEKAHNQR